MISPHPEFEMGMRNHKKSWDGNGTWVTRPIALPSYINTITSMRVWGEDVVGDSKVRGERSMWSHMRGFLDLNMISSFQRMF